MAKKDTASAPSIAPDAAVQEVQDTSARDAPAAAQAADAKPGSGSRIMARVGASLRAMRRRRFLIVGGAAVLIGLNVGMAVAVDGWRGEDAALRADNEDLGRKLADARATAASQVEEIALVTDQAGAAQAKADELAPVAEAQQAVADSLKAAGILLKQCVNDRGTLIANLWVSSASAQAGLEAQVNATCASAQAAFDAIPKEN